MLKAHAASGKDIIGIFIGAQIEILTAFSGKIIDIFLHKGLSKGHCRGISHIHCACRFVIAAALAQHGICRVEDGIHMPRGIDKGNDADALFLGVGNDIVHFRLSQLIALRAVMVGQISLMDGISDSCTFVGRSVGCHGHIIQEEAHAVVAHGQLHVGIAVVLGLCNEGLDPPGRKILPSAVQMDNLHIFPGGKDTQRHCRKQHCQDQKSRQKTVQLFHKNPS